MVAGKAHDVRVRACALRLTLGSRTPSYQLCEYVAPIYSIKERLGCAGRDEPASTTRRGRCSNHTLSHSTVARPASAVPFFRFFPLLSVPSEAASRSRCRFSEPDLGAAARGGASTPAGFMNPFDSVFAAFAADVDVERVAAGVS